MERVAIKDLVYESNRKYGKDAGFEQLVESVREYGVLEPILVRREEGKYRVIAGRRRTAAAAAAGLQAVDCVVREDDADDDELALVENINRLEMHPLEEADIFRRMKDAGATVEYIGRYFARPPWAIYQRIRLSGLGEQAREMFREGRLDIKGAVLLSGLEEKDQEAFVTKREGKEADGWTVQDYITRTKKWRIYPVLEEGRCGNCGERTRNGEAGLFEGEEGFDDVCLNPPCYREAWRLLIGAALSEAAAGREGGGEKKIAFEESPLRSLYQDAGSLVFDGDSYRVLTGKEYSLGREETRRKKNVYWRVSLSCDGTRIGTKCCGYEKKEALQKRQDKEEGERLVKDYGKENLGGLGERTGETPEALARGLFERNIHGHKFKTTIAERVRRRVAERNLAEGDGKNYAAMYLKYRERNREADLEKYSGFKDYGEVRLEAGGQRLFHFLISRIFLNYYEVTPLEDLADPEGEYRETLFWEYAGMDEASYRELYLEETRRVMEHLKNGRELKDLDDAELPDNGGEAPGGEDGGA